MLGGRQRGPLGQPTAAQRGDVILREAREDTLRQAVRLLEFPLA